MQTGCLTAAVTLWEKNAVATFLAPPGKFTLDICATFARRKMEIRFFALPRHTVARINIPVRVYGKIILVVQMASGSFGFTVQRVRGIVHIQIMRKLHNMPYNLHAIIFRYMGGLSVKKSGIIADVWGIGKTFLQHWQERVKLAYIVRVKIQTQFNVNTVIGKFLYRVQKLWKTSV